VAEVIVRIISVSASTMIKPLRMVLNKREKLQLKRRITTTKENSTRTMVIKRKTELRKAVVVGGVEAGAVAVATLIDPAHKVKSITITARESRPMEMKLETSAEDVEVEADN